MESTTSLMRLEYCALTSLRIDAARAPETGEEETEDVALDFDVRPHKTESKFLIPFTLTITWPRGKGARFKKIEVTLDSVFAFPEGTEEAAIQQYVPLLCLTNLLGIARGIIGQATGLCPGGPYLPPLVNMNSLLKETLERKAAAREARERTTHGPVAHADRRLTGGRSHNKMP